MLKTTISMAFGAVVLAGCSSMSGLDSSNNFACSAPLGVSCTSISGVHANAMAGTLPYQVAESQPVASGNSGSGSSSAQRQPLTPGGRVSPRDLPAVSSGMPVRQAPLVLRIWVAPYEDENNDLYDQSFMYTMVHSGKWMIEANRRNIMNQYKPVFPLPRSADSAAQPQGQVQNPQSQSQNMRDDVARNLSPLDRGSGMEQ